MKLFLVLLLLVAVTGCSAALKTDPDLLVIDQSRMSAPDLHIDIPGLGNCTDGPDHTLHLNSQEPVLVLVHGCRGSAGRFRALAEVFAYSGQQAVCFSYNDRESLMVSSAKLRGSLRTVAGRLQNKKITVIGHSQGGLVARKALVADLPGPLQSELDLHLITISAPFSGIRAASHCGSTLGKVLSLGLMIPICKAVSGDKWYEITAVSPFMRQPGDLVAQVADYLKINTDETGTCRVHRGDGGCSEGDFVFSLDEQRQAMIDASQNVTNVDVKAGHVEIVGDYRQVPVKLVELLQQHGVLREVRPERAADFRQFMSKTYAAEEQDERRGR